MKNIMFTIALFMLLALVGCHSDTNTADTETSEVKTPVTVASVENTSISESISLNATSSYLKKNQVKANVNGYIEKVFVNIGDRVEAGNPLFSIKTKEAEALSNYKDSLFAVKGNLTISAPSSGIVTEVDKQLNDYVNDGDLAAVIADRSSFVFLLNVPFELNKYASIGTPCAILLPDSTTLKGILTSKLSAVDAASQTQSYVVKPQTNSTLPEGLLAVVQLNKTTKQNAQVIDKSCVLTDETMEKFWVMKLIDDSTAVKIPIQKGISTDTKIEIISPQFSPTDRILKTGNFGLPDTAFVMIQQ